MLDVTCQEVLERLLLMLSAEGARGARSRRVGRGVAMNHRPPAICVTQIQASQCPALSNTPLANCSAWYAQQVLAAYRTPSIGVSVAVDMTTAPATVTICASRSFDFIAPHLLPYGPLDLMSSVTVPII